MSKRFLALIGILAVAVILVSGCTQQEPGPSPEPPPEGGGEITGNIGLGLDLDNTEDSASDLNLSDLDTLDSDLDNLIDALE